MADRVMTALKMKLEVPGSWLPEAYFATSTQYRNRGLMNDCEVVVRWHFNMSTLDVVAFERMLDVLAEREMTVEDFLLAIASQVALVCKAWFQVQVRADVPGTDAPLTVSVKRKQG